MFAGVRTAVDAAVEAFQNSAWSGLPPAARKRLLFRLADPMDAHADELAAVEPSTLEMR
jgi:acyl-CoA reductase-like NAD-dependent aldehyde dehydrogenase